MSKMIDFDMDLPSFDWEEEPEPKPDIIMLRQITYLSNLLEVEIPEPKTFDEGAEILEGLLHDLQQYMQCSFSELWKEWAMSGLCKAGTVALPKEQMDSRPRKWEKN